MYCPCRSSMLEYQLGEVETRIGVSLEVTIVMSVRRIVPPTQIAWFALVALSALTACPRASARCGEHARTDSGHLQAILPTILPSGRPLPQEAPPPRCAGLSCPQSPIAPPHAPPPPSRPPSDRCLGPARADCGDRGVGRPLTSVPDLSYLSPILDGADRPPRP